MIAFGLRRYAGQQIVILGMARQGLALARFFVVQGALVTISDLRPERELATACADLLAYAAEHAPSGVSQSSAKGL